MAKKTTAKSKNAADIGKRVKSGPTGSVNASNQPPKSKPTSPSSYEIFLKTIKRASNLIEIHKNTSKCEEFHFDSFRAAVVLSISALDAYTRTLVIEKIIFQLSNESQDIPDKLKTYIKNIMSQDSLLEAARKYKFKETVEKAIRADFETKSFQGEYKIDSYMELAGYKDIFEKVSHSANKSKSRFKDDIQKYTIRRHIIAHCGDFDLSQIPHLEQAIDKEFSKNCIEIVKEFAEHLSKVTK
jgi:hypothetical protein